MNPAVDADGTVQVPAHSVPLSRYLSEEARRKFIEDHRKPNDWPDPRTATIQEIREAVDKDVRPKVERARRDYPVRIEARAIAGVSTQIVTPERGVASQNKERTLINLHGGGFALGGGGLHGLLESIPVAVVSRMQVVSIDYRQGPEHKFPAATDDVTAVYQALLKQYASSGIGIFGCSAGGALTAMSAAWIEQQQFPRPGAIGIFGAGAYAHFGSDPRSPGTWGGDSRYFANPLQAQAPLPLDAGAAALASPIDYLSDVSLADPLVSPGETPAVLRKFPPTLLISGTRAYDMSAAVQTHRVLTRVDVAADLHLWDGLGHCFFLDTELPESKEMLDVVARFFDRHLSR
jgi:epsilon-lactone hydrolase